MSDILYSALIWLCPELSGTDEGLRWALQIKDEFDAEVSRLEACGY